MVITTLRLLLCLTQSLTSFLKDACSNLCFCVSQPLQTEWRRGVLGVTTGYVCILLSTVLFEDNASLSLLFPVQINLKVAVLEKGYIEVSLNHK